MRDARGVSRHGGVPTVALAVVLAVVLTGCARTIDSDKAEETISIGTVQRTGSKVTSVDCPSDQTAKKGNTFTCRVVAADGTRGQVFVTVTADTGRVRFRVPFRNTKTTERSMAVRLTRRSGHPVSVDCPDIIARRKGVVFTCATSGKSRGRVRARQIDGDANVRYRQLEGE